MSSELLPFKALAPGAPFFLDRYYGNVYRKVDEKTAEFVAHRLNSQYVGCKLSFSPVQACRRGEALSPETLDLLGIDPEAEPFLIRYQPPAGWELLGDAPAPARKPAPRDEDLLGTFPQPECPNPQKLSGTERRAARKARKLVELNDMDLL